MEVAPLKKWFALFLALILSLSWAFSLAETPAGGNPPPMPPEGQAPGNPPDGGMPGGGPSGPGGPGGMPGAGPGSQPTSYAAVTTFAEDTSLEGGSYSSTGTDENAVLVTSGTVTLTGATLTQDSQDSAGGDSASFYGVGAALLVTGGTANISGSGIATDAAGGAGVFAYGDGVAYVSDTVISTRQGASGGIHVAGGGSLYARNLTVETEGGSSAAIRSDRGGGNLVVDGGTYVSNGSGSPALYCTADITVNNAALTANGSEALCLEGLNTVRLFDTSLTGNMPDLEQNDNTWTVILYQSMSGDSQVGKGIFEMAGGTLVSENGGLFYTTNTESEFVLSGVKIVASEDSEYFLRCTGNANQRGWGPSGANGADCTFTAIAQEMNGDILWDSISQLDLYVTQSSVLTGAVLRDESFAGDGGSGDSSLFLDATSRWVVTGDSTVTHLYSEGSIVDANGNAVSIIGADGAVHVQGSSPYTVTVSSFQNSCDTSGAGTATNFLDYAVDF